MDGLVLVVLKAAPSSLGVGSFDARVDVDWDAHRRRSQAERKVFANDLLGRGVGDLVVPDGAVLLPHLLEDRSVDEDAGGTGSGTADEGVVGKLPADGEP